MKGDASIARLATLAGLAGEYRDATGARRRVPAASRRRLLAALGFDVGDDTVLARAVARLEDAQTRSSSEHDPAPCFLPPALSGTGRAWGIAVQLYGVRSARNWGIGDYSDLLRLVEGAAALGAGAVGVNPLHASFPHRPEVASPYGASSRLFLNALYLDVEAIPDLAECPEAGRRVAHSDFRDRLARLRAAPLVDHSGVARAKREILEPLWSSFRERCLGSSPRAQGEAFERFRRDRGDHLARHATFEAIAERECGPGGAGPDWRRWPAALRDPASPEVARFAHEHAERVGFFAWLQWQADEQLARVAARTRALGMPVGVYADVALGVAPDGAEAWANQSLLARGVSVGAPPDEWNLLGQDWGFPPYHPQRLREGGCAPFAAALDAVMRHAGAVRIDHVLGLERLFWVPHGATPAEGGYVRYPFHDLLAALARASHRHECLVVGEDLGTVPRGLRPRLQRANVLSYRLLYFAHDESARVIEPARWPRLALAACSTHDLAPLAGYWEAHDLDVRGALGLYPSPRAEHETRAARERERRALAEALARDGLIETPPETTLPPYSEALAEAVYTYLGRTPCRIVMVQPEDITGEREQANVPGTTDEHPNWQRKLARDLDTLLADARLGRVAARLEALRGPGEGGA